MSILPDELWRRILEIGIERSNLNYKDLCCVSITCRRLNRISEEEFLWSFLLSSDFKYPTDSPRPVVNMTSAGSSSSGTTFSCKAQYRIRYERDKEQKLLAHRRRVLRIESEIAECSRKIREIELDSADERERMRKTFAELSNLHKARQASVALNVWQPEIIRGRQKQIVEQCDVPAESRISSLEMELRLCKKQITGCDKALKAEKGKLAAAKEKLASVKYHPLNNFNWNEYGIDEQRMRRKRLKHSSKMTDPSQRRRGVSQDLGPVSDRSGRLHGRHPITASARQRVSAARHSTSDIPATTADVTRGIDSTLFAPHMPWIFGMYAPIPGYVPYSWPPMTSPAPVAPDYYSGGPSYPVQTHSGHAEDVGPAYYRPPSVPVTPYRHPEDYDEGSGAADDVEDGEDPATDADYDAGADIQEPAADAAMQEDETYEQDIPHTAPTTSSARPRRGFLRRVMAGVGSLVCSVSGSGVSARRDRSPGPVPYGVSSSARPRVSRSFRDGPGVPPTYCFIVYIHLQVCWTPFGPNPLKEYWISAFHGCLRFCDVVEPYIPDRVLRQFGRVQQIPTTPILSKEDYRPANNWRYVVRYECPDEFWERPESHILGRTQLGAHAFPPSACTPEYLPWYLARTHPSIQNPGMLPAGVSRPGPTPITDAVRWDMLHRAVAGIIDVQQLTPAQRDATLQDVIHILTEREHCLGGTERAGPSGS